MQRDLRHREEIIRASGALLSRAEVGDRLPTPVDDLVAAAGLHRGEDDLFAEGTIEEAPAHLRRAIRALRGKVHAVLDRRAREVYVDPAIQHEGRRRFRALHEVGHDILPSQSDPAEADDAYTLSWLTNVLKEQDANQVASELLFQQERFTRMAREYRIGFAAITELAQRFGGSIQAGLRRFVEFHQAPLAGVALDTRCVHRDPDVYRRYEAVCSPLWQQRFGRPDHWPRELDETVFPFLSNARAANLWGQVGWEGAWPDRNGTAIEMRAEVLSTTYRLLVLVWEPQRERLKRKRVLTPSVAP